MNRERAIEAAARFIYEAKGDRVGVNYVGWKREPKSVKDEWRQDVRETIEAYERELGLPVIKDRKPA